MSKIKCSECGGMFSQWMMRIQYKNVSAHVIDHGYVERAILYAWCEVCHPKVFAEASHEKYPEIFLESIDLGPRGLEWMSAVEMARLMGLRTGAGVSSLFRQCGGVVKGNALERRSIGRVGQREIYQYRVKET